MDEYSNTEVDAILDGIVRDIRHQYVANHNKFFGSYYDIHVNLVDDDIIIKLDKKFDYLPDVSISTETYKESDGVSIYVSIDEVGYIADSIIWDADTTGSYKVVRNLANALDLLIGLDDTTFYTTDYI